MSKLPYLKSSYLGTHAYFCNTDINRVPESKELLWGARVRNPNNNVGMSWECEDTGKHIACHSPTYCILEDARIVFRNSVHLLTTKHLLRLVGLRGKTPTRPGLQHDEDGSQCEGARPRQTLAGLRTQSGILKAGVYICIYIYTYIEAYASTYIVLYVDLYANAYVAHIKCSGRKAPYRKHESISQRST